jgi:putative redox protein
MPTLTGRIGTDHFVTDLTSDSGHALLADEPLADGGQNMGLSPGELLAASLSSCTCITVRMYADRKQWPLREVVTHVSFERNDKHVITHMTRAVQFEGNLTDEQRQRLLQVANACPIHKALTNSVIIDTKLA